MLCVKAHPVTAPRLPPYCHLLPSYCLLPVHQNVPTAKTHHLCANWPDTARAFPKNDKPKRYDWIVSNPPVTAL